MSDRIDENSVYHVPLLIQTLEVHVAEGDEREMVFGSRAIKAMCLQIAKNSQLVTFMNPSLSTHSISLQACNIVSRTSTTKSRPLV